MVLVRGSVLLGAAVLAQESHAKVYFKEQFNDEGWKERWVQPTKWKPEEQMGKWGWTAGKWYGDESDKGIQTSEDSRFYGLSAKLSEPFTNEGKDLVLQLSVKHEQYIDCGGAYIKLLGDINQDEMGGDTPYQVMFGPDICGSGNQRTHVIFNYPPKDENLLIKNKVKVERDQVTHVYTLHVKTDGTYEVFIDRESVRSGKLEEDWDFLPPKEIEDPDQSKPEDWVDEKKMPDPEDKKPEGYDDIPPTIADASAEKPDDWDEEEDGEWEPPMVSNPEYKGPWTPKMIDNPAYKGPWVHPLIPNPDYKEDPKLAVRCDKCSTIGFELWQVKSGTLFDDIIVTDSLDEAWAFADETFAKKKDKEKEMHEKVQEEERKAAEAEMPQGGGEDDEFDADEFEEFAQGGGGGAMDMGEEEEEDHDEL